MGSWGRRPRKLSILREMGKRISGSRGEGAALLCSSGKGGWGVCGGGAKISLFYFLFPCLSLETQNRELEEQLAALEEEGVDAEGGRLEWHRPYRRIGVLVRPQWGGCVDRPK